MSTPHTRADDKTEADEKLEASAAQVANRLTHMNAVRKRVDQLINATFAHAGDTAECATAALGAEVLPVSLTVASRGSLSCCPYCF